MQQDFRQVMGHFATGVAVITTIDDTGQPRGLTVNSFTSLSLDPPLVLVCVDHGSQTHAALQGEGATFAVNILTRHQERLSRLFASKAPDKFQSLVYRAGVTGAPLLDDVLAHLECRVVDRFANGDHTIVIGAVCALRQATAAEPLLYYQGRYAVLADAGGPQHGEHTLEGAIAHQALAVGYST